MDIAIIKINCNKQQGTAMVEFLISLLFFVPLFVTLPIIGKYISFKHKNIESHRYAVWERTIWSEPGASWNDNENSKGNIQLEEELDYRFYGNQLQGMSTTVLSSNNLWVDENQQPLLTKSENDMYRVRISASSGLSPVKNEFADRYAYDGIPVIGGVLTKASSQFISGVGTLLSHCKDVPGINFEKGMDLGSRTFASISVSSRLRNKTLSDHDNKKNNNEIRFRAQGSILSNAWTAPTEIQFKQRVNNLVIDEAVKCIASPSILLSAFPVYKEGKNGSEVAGSASSMVILQNYLP